MNGYPGTVKCLECVEYCEGEKEANEGNNEKDAADNVDYVTKFQFFKIHTSCIIRPSSETYLLLMKQDENS